MTGTLCAGVCVCACTLFLKAHSQTQKSLRVPCLAFLPLSFCLFSLIPPSIFLFFFLSFHLQLSASFFYFHSLASLLLYHSLFPSCLKGRYLSLWIKTLHQWSDGELWVQHNWNQSLLDYREARVISPSWIYWEKQKLLVKCCTDLKINSTC